MLVVTVTGSSRGTLFVFVGFDSYREISWNFVCADGWSSPFHGDRDYISLSFCCCGRDRELSWNFVCTGFSGIDSELLWNFVCLI